MKEIIIVGFSNKVNNYKEKSISSKNRQVRNNLKSVVYWKELKENIIYSTSLGNNNIPVINISVGTLS